MEKQIVLGPDQVEAMYLGMLLQNVQMFEFLLRWFLDGSDKQSAGATTLTDIFEAGVDDLLSESPLTNFDNLGELIEKYNAAVFRTARELRVDVSVVETRDLLAHGRFLESRDRKRLLKFSKPRDGTVRVTHAAEYGYEWIEREATRLADASDKVKRAITVFGYQKQRPPS